MSDPLRGRARWLSAGVDGFTLLIRGQPPYRVRWDEVERVTAYKRDMVTSALVCLDLELPERGVTFPLHEDVAGFQGWREAFEAALPPGDPEWWAHLLASPFAPNAAVIYERIA